MSHFTCLVLGDNVEEQLYPFEELECSHSLEEIKKDSRAKFVQEFTTEELEKEFIKIKNEHPEYYYKDLEEFADKYYGYSKLENENSWGRWTNPNSRWDWFTIGGRWTGFFKVKEDPEYPDDIFLGSPEIMLSWQESGTKAREGYADSIRLCDVDFDSMNKENIKKLNKNWNNFEKALKGDSKTPYWSFGVQENEKRRDYIKRNIGFSTYAIIKDGEWYSKGNMGWWGISSNEKDNWNDEFNKLIESLPKDTQLTLIDCHI